MRKDDKVLIRAYNPPLEGKVAGMYTIPTRNIQDQRLISKYPNGVPMVEVFLNNGKLQVFVKDMVEAI